MKKQLVIIGIVAILVCVGLSGCNQISNPLNSEKNRFVGTWIYGTQYMTVALDLFSDGTCSYANNPGIWELKDGKLTLELTGGLGLALTYNYVFSDNDRTLTLTSSSGGEPEVFTKQ